MFNAYEFTYAGKSSAEFDLMIYDIDDHTQEDVPFGNIASVVETRINRRIQPIHYGVNYHTEPLEFTLVFGAQHPLDRYDLQQIVFWLTGYEEYQWLTIGQLDLQDVQFRCLFSEITPITVGWLPYAFEATVLCDCPYAYSYPFVQDYQLSGTKTVTFWNKSTTREYFKPDLTYKKTSSGNSLKIVNKTDNNRTFELTGLPGGDMTINIDNKNGILCDSRNEVNLYPMFNLNFLRMVPGDNTLEITGNGTLSISGRFLYNTGA